MKHHLSSSGREKGSVFLSFYRDAFRLLVLHRSLDEIAQKNGWRFHTDGLHLNSRGGKILADLVQEFISTET